MNNTVKLREITAIQERNINKNYMNNPKKKQNTENNWKINNNEDNSKSKNNWIISDTT